MGPGHTAVVVTQAVVFAAAPGVCIREVQRLQISSHALVDGFNSVVSLVLPVLADRTRDGETGCCLCGMEPGHTATVVTEAVVFGTVLGVVYENYGDPDCVGSVGSVVWDLHKLL